MLDQGVRRNMFVGNSYCAQYMVTYLCLFHASLLVDIEMTVHTSVPPASVHFV